MKSKMWIVIICVFLSLNTISFAESQKENCKKLVVSIGYDGYFDQPVEKTGLDNFKKQYPDWEVECVIESQSDNVFDQAADVYFISPERFDIQEILFSPKTSPIEKYVSEDTKENVYLLDQMTNRDGQISAIPVFLGVYMLCVGGEDLYTYIDSTGHSKFNEKTFETWENLYNWGCDYPFKKDDEFTLVGGLEIIARQISLMATKEGNDNINFDTGEIRNLLIAWKRFADNGLVDVRVIADTTNKNGPMYRRAGIVNIDHGMFLNWNSTERDAPLFMPLPEIGNSKSCPIAARIGIVSSISENKEMATKFIESFVSVDAQLYLPTAGIVRKDIWKKVNDLYQEGSDWATNMEMWYGKPVSLKAYTNYMYSLENGRIGIGSFRSTNISSLVIEKYLRGEITLEETLLQLRKLLEEQTTKYF